LYSSSGNRIFHNDFLNNTQQTEVVNSTNTWDDGYPSGGNYWSDYQTRYSNATEIDGSGIWNTPYVIDINNIDYYPLVAPFRSFNVVWSNQTYSIGTVSNSSLSNFSWGVLSLESHEFSILTFNVTGVSGTVGFCRVDIPTGFMAQLGSWSLRVGGTLYSNETIMTSGNYTYIYFTYAQNSTETVQIANTYIVSEFQSPMLLPLFMIITLLGAIVLKRNRKVKKWTPHSSFALFPIQY
jgi:hypothetical protein